MVETSETQKGMNIIVNDSTYAEVYNIHNSNPLLGFDESKSTLILNLPKDKSQVADLKNLLINLEKIFVLYKESSNIFEHLIKLTDNVFAENKTEYNKNCMRLLEEFLFLSKTDILTSRLVSTVLAAFLGDSLGSYCEFQKGNPKLFNEKKVFKELNPVFYSSPGQLTDDSEMALSLLYGILDSYQNFDPNKVAFYYLKWLITNPQDIGQTTLAALVTPFDSNLANPKNLIYSNKFYEIMSSINSVSTSLSNGFLMRKTPLCIYNYQFQITNNLDLMIKTSQEDTRLTHGSEETVEASVFYNILINYIIRYQAENPNASTKEIARFSLAESVKYMKENYKNTPSNANINKLIHLCENGKLSEYKFIPSTFFHQMGFYFHGLAKSIELLYRASQGEEIKLKSALIETINLGGDTDTNAAIVGGVLGALVGVGNEDLEYLIILVCFNPLESNIIRPSIYAPIFGLIGSMEIAKHIKELNQGTSYQPRHTYEIIIDFLIGILNKDQ